MSRTKNFLSFLSLLIPLVHLASFAQVDENTDLWRIRGDAQYGLPAATGTWHGDSLWVGATFMRDTTKRFIVWLANYYVPQGTYKGALYLMIPRPGLPDSARFLFRNRCNATAPTTIDLTDSTPTIRHMDTLFFMYRSDSVNNGSGSCSNFQSLTNDLSVYQGDSLFTGPNRAPGEGWLNVDRHYSARNDNALTNPPIPKTFFSLNQQKNVPYGRRWCEAAWVHTVLGGNVRTDTVEFGFEDQFNGRDINFEDIRFNVSGVFLIHPVHVNALLLDLFPPKDTIPAGDSISYLAVLLGSDSLGHAFRDSTNLAMKVVWDLKKSPQSRSAMTQGAGPTNANTFRAVTAFEWDTITASYTDQSGNKLTAAIPVWVKAGKPTHVVIEADSLAANTRADRPVDTITITKISPRTVYAVERDTFGNFAGMATNATWRVTSGSIAAATPPQGKSTTVSELDSGTTVLIASEPLLAADSAFVNATGPTGAIPVTAVMLDMNGNGHLDRIDIVFPDSISLLSTLPSARAWIVSAGIISDDGNATVNLVVDTVLRGGGDTIHVMLRENTGPTLETGWPNASSAHVTLSSAPVTVDLRPFTVTKVIDRAAPVIKSLCFAPASAFDTLRVFFSEPVDTPANRQRSDTNYFKDTSSNGLTNYFIIANSLTDNKSTGNRADSIKKPGAGNELVYLYNPGTLTDMQAVKENGIPGVPLGLCGDVSIVRAYHIASNPFKPRETAIPYNQQDHSSPNPVTTGTRIEVTLIPSVTQELLNHKIRGTVTIFDAVGNTIYTKDSLSIDSARVKLFTTWSGITNKGAYAGGGTYLARIIILDDVRNRSQTIRQAVGIKQ